MNWRSFLNKNSHSTIVQTLSAATVKLLLQKVLPVTTNV